MSYTIKYYEQAIADAKKMNLLLLRNYRNLSRN